jgi:hypothetical protein
MRPNAVLRDIFPSWYGAGSATARAEATSTEETARVLKSILMELFAGKNECVNANY